MLDGGQKAMNFVFEKIKIVFPRSSDFIRDLPLNVVTIFKKLGWNIPNTIFLEVPYAMAYSANLEPATCTIQLFPIYEKGVYFRSLISTEGYVGSASSIDIEDTVLHERKELESIEKLCKEGPKADLEQRFSLSDISEEVSVRLAEEYATQESEIFGYTSEMLAKKYGKERVLENHVKAIRLNYDIRAKLGLVIGGYLQLWTWKYLKHNFNNYAHEAIPIPSLLKEIRRTYETYMEKIEQDCLTSPDMVEREALRFLY
jgi:hypothetical protein